jgi:hypothetical protein
MLIPGAIMMGIGSFLVLCALIVGFKLRSKSATNLGSEMQSTSSDNDWFAKLVKESDAIAQKISNNEKLSHHDRVLEEMNFPDKAKVEFDIKQGSSLQKWYAHLLHDPAKSRIIASELGLEAGGAGYDFEGNWRTKGLFAYRSGKYSGHAYFGTGGSDEERLEAEYDDEKYRPWDRNDSKVPENIRKIWLNLEPVLARSYYLDPPNTD